MSIDMTMPWGCQRTAFMPTPLSMALLLCRMHGYPRARKRVHNFIVRARARCRALTVHMQAAHTTRRYSTSSQAFTFHWPVVLSTASPSSGPLRRVSRAWHVVDINIDINIDAHTQDSMMMLMH